LIDTSKLLLTHLKNIGGYRRLEKSRSGAKARADSLKFTSNKDELDIQQFFMNQFIRKSPRVRVSGNPLLVRDSPIRIAALIEFSQFSP
jgi:hypothetical protein